MKPILPILSLALMLTLVLGIQIGRYWERKDRRMEAGTREMELARSFGPRVSPCVCRSVSVGGVEFFVQDNGATLIANPGAGRKWLLLPVRKGIQ